MKPPQEGSLSGESVPGITAAVSPSAILAFPPHFPLLGAKNYPVSHFVPDSRARGVYSPGNVSIGLHLACAGLCVLYGGNNAKLPSKKPVSDLEIAGFFVFIFCSRRRSG